MIIYLLKSAGCLALLLFFYHFILEKEKMHTFNRFYLLGGVLFSFFAPLITIKTYVKPEIIRAIKTFETPFIVDNSNTTPIEEPTNYMLYALILYGFISAVFFLRFVRNLYKISKKIKTNAKVYHQKAILVLVEDTILPHTFWNYIFVNKKEYENNQIEEELFTHEITHAIQKHTFDVLIIEALQAVFWINPLFIFLKKAIQLNHEFLADETVINKHKNTFQYQHLLLNKAAWKNEYYLASNLNYSLTKKRLEMMTTQSSRTKILLKKLAVIPLITGFIFLFAERVEAQNENTIETIYEQEPKKNNSDLYNQFVYKNGFITTKDENGNTIKKKYSELSEDEKKKLPPPPPLKIAKKVLSKKLFEQLKVKNKYALWIDGKVVENKILNNYKHSDFSNYFISFVNKNSRSKRFPQKYQANLATHKYFKNENKKKTQNFKKHSSKYQKDDSIKFHKNWYITIDGEKYYYTFDKNERVARYYKNSKKVDLDIVKEYNKKHNNLEKLKNSGKHYIFKTESEKKIIDREFSDLAGMYFRMSRVDKNKVPYPEHPIKPYVRLRKGTKVWYKKRSELTEEDKLLIPPPPPAPNASKEEIIKARKAYKAWKKRTGNDIPPPPPPKHLKEVKVEKQKWKKKKLKKVKPVKIEVKKKKLKKVKETKENN